MGKAPACAITPAQIRADRVIKINGGFGRRLAGRPNSTRRSNPGRRYSKFARGVFFSQARSMRSPHFDATIVADRSWVTDMRRMFHIKRVGQFEGVGRINIHVIAGPGLGRSPMSAPVIGDQAIGVHAIGHERSISGGGRSSRRTSAATRQGPQLANWLRNPRRKSATAQRSSRNLRRR